jgi:hypothetical protein
MGMFLVQRLLHIAKDFAVLARLFFKDTLHWLDSFKCAAIPLLLAVQMVQFVFGL